jgi:ATP-dependent Zn protease
MTRSKKALLVALILLVAAIGIWHFFFRDEVVELSFGDLSQATAQGRVLSAELSDRKVEGELKGHQRFSSLLGNPELAAELARAMRAQGARVTFAPHHDWVWKAALVFWLPLLGLVALLFLAASSPQSDGAGDRKEAREAKKAVARFPPSAVRAKEVTTDFRDVAGYERAKRELQEIVHALQSSEAFSHLGGEAPRTVLMEGPPGTGKTMLARAVASAAQAKFFALSGSQFVEMYVGVGPGRVRNLFKAAVESAPSVIFVDEVDAIARRRGDAALHSHMEHDNTLNELLVQLDGFWKEAQKDVIFIAATNREDVLDPAFLQRMDRRIRVGVPTQEERIRILRKHAPPDAFDLDEEDLSEVAVQTAGMTGRELKNLAQEATRQRYQRLLTEATEECRRSPDGEGGSVLRPLPGQGEVDSPVVFAGRCRPGSVVTVILGGTKLTLLDDDEDGVWAGALGSDAGKKTARAHFKPRQGEPVEIRPFSVMVTSRRRRCSLEDFQAALRQDGIRIPPPRKVADMAPALERVLGQEDAKAVLSGVLALHYAKCRTSIEAHQKIPAGAALLLGPPGVGKTLLVRSLADHLGVPFVAMDALSLLDGGGGEAMAEQLLRRLVKAARGSTERARYGIVCVQNLQQLGDRLNSGPGVAILHMLHNLIEGDTVEVSLSRNLLHGKSVVIETRGILFVLEGHFRRLEDKAYERRTVQSPAGASVHRCILPADLVELGFPPTLAERLAAHSTVLQPLSHRDLSRLAEERWEVVKKDYEPLLAGSGRGAKLLSTGPRAIATVAEERRTGGWAVDAVLHEVFQLVSRTCPPGETAVVDEPYVWSAVYRKPVESSSPAQVANEEAVLQRLVAKREEVRPEADASRAALPDSSWLDVVSRDLSLPG